MRTDAAIQPLNFKLTFLSFVCAVCAGLMQVKIVLVGEIMAGELMLVMVALFVLLLKGVGHHVNVPTVLLFGIAVFLMLIGYLVSDLIAVTEPAQYLRGWARVALFGLDMMALAVIVSHGERYLWWFAFGLGVGILANLLIGLMPFTTTNWKLGYGPGIGILAALLSGCLGRFSGAALLVAVGILSNFMDYRSLSGILIGVGGIVLTQSGMPASKRRGVARGALPIIALAIAFIVVVLTLTLSNEEFELRRKESNLGRYVGVVVAARAVAESPVIGYGSWAADKGYAAIRNQELAKEAAASGIPIQAKASESIMPHSQLLQAWVEGGFLGALFFLIYGWYLLLAMHWLTFVHIPARMTPLYLMFVATGLWNLLASPFLGGDKRIGIACATVVLAIVAKERSNAGKARNRQDKATTGYST